MSATRAKAAQPLTWSDRLDLVGQVLAVVGLDDVKPGDVLSIHLGVRAVGVRRKVRGRTGRVVPGLTLATSHDVLPEPVED